MSRNSFYFRCPVCGNNITTKKPLACPKCGKVKFTYQGEEVRPAKYQLIEGSGDLMDMVYPIPGESKSSKEDPKKSPIIDKSKPKKTSRRTKVVKKGTFDFWKLIKWFLAILAIILLIAVIFHVAGWYTLPGLKNITNSEPVALTNPQTQQYIAQLEADNASLSQENQSLFQQNQGLIVQQQPVTEKSAQQIINYPTEPIVYAAENGKTMTNFGVFLDTELGQRITYTNRNLLVPDKAWNDPLTQNELWRVENTWVNVAVDLPVGMSATIFGHDFQQGNVILGKGVFIDLTQPGHYEFHLKNGEVVIWYPGQEQHKANDWKRIEAQVNNGNFDILHQLDLTSIYK